jgi:FkbM family methyltransferase
MASLYTQIRSYIKRLPLVSLIKNKIVRIFKRPSNNDAAWLLSRCLVAPAGQIVQIGSNDGSTNDPIHSLLRARRQWRGLFVEPVPFIFARLTTNYPAESRFQFENAAITNERQATFFWVDEMAARSLPNLPTWHDQLGSFDRNHIVKHLGGILEPFIASAPVACMTLPTLLTKHRITHVDVLHIDTEGHDWTVLSQLDLSQHQPDVILYEHRHLGSSEKAASLRYLAETYDLYDLGRDFFAIKRKSERLSRESLVDIAHLLVIPPKG